MTSPVKFETLFRRGTELLRKGNSADAVPVLEMAYDIDPDHADVMLNLSGAYILTNQFKKAVPLLEKLKTMDPDNAMVWTNLGAAYLGNPVLAKDDEQLQAIGAFEKALAINPVAPNVAYNIGLIYRDRQEWTTAVAWFKKARQANPNDQDARNIIARLEKKMENEARFAPFAERMQSEGLPDVFIDTFAHYYKQLVAGQTGMISEADIEPVTSLPDAEALPDALIQVGAEALTRTAVIKLNGGLGTSMGLQKAKALLPVKNGLSFLDIIAQQTIIANVPLVLMNSFVTDDDSLAALADYDLVGDLPRSFVQHKEPKVVQSDFSPAEWPTDPDLEWCPPGHGDIYTALITRGTLQQLLNAGYEYAFVSNADNLGAVIDRAILGYFASNNLPFMMEVADRTEMDKKGGHLAQRPDGRLILRESAQCPDEDMDQFQDIDRHKYFNTNNLWLHLPTLQSVMAERGNTLGLPMIRNSKTVDPRDSESMAVYQLETAMGSAIGVFEGAQAIRVPRSRFAPVKKTNELLAVRSDAYQLTDDFFVMPNGQRPLADLVIDLDERYYKLVDQLAARFPKGTPSFLKCTRFIVEGDFLFGKNITCEGDVELINHSDQQITIPDDTHLSGQQQYD